MTKSDNLKGKSVFGTTTAAQHELVFDDKMLTNPSDDTTKCNVGMSFKEGHVGMLQQVKYFMRNLQKSRFADKTAFEGSNDG
jgi:hypothetical protein